MITSEQIKKAARAQGADIVGIGSLDRYEGAPKQMDIRQIMPGAKSIVAMGFRHYRGVFRGIEEGTFFTAYSAMGYAGINYIYQPLVLWEVGKLLEDEGYDVLPVPNNFPWGNSDGSGTVPERVGKMNPAKSRPVSDDKPAPDVFPHMRIAAFVAGLGEIGYSKMFLTPEFGPRQRMGIVITELELEPDPLYPDTDGPKLCNRCMACVRECPTGAISTTKTVKVNLAGHDVEWGEIDCKACGTAFRGGLVTDEPLDDAATYMPPENGKNVTQAPWTPFNKKPRNLYNTGQAICGARGCTRACMISCETRGVLKNQFKDKFRRRPAWSVDWSEDAAMPEGAPVLAPEVSTSGATQSGSVKEVD